MHILKISVSKIILATGLAVFISGCTTTGHFDWVAVGGSKADGNVVLGIDVPAKMGISETHVEQDPEQANAEADRRCKNWGYGGAEVFRKGQFPVQKICYPQGFSPCWSKSYRIQYQCVDKEHLQVPLQPPPLPQLSPPRNDLPIHRIHHRW